jgi:NAD(P)-dependent dehydrogenase (short-subunit alcohol dehydrogenase family)
MCERPGAVALRREEEVTMGILDTFRLDGKKAFVTGSTRGLGKVSALALAEAGADVAIIGTTQEPADAVAREIADKTGVRTVGVQADVSQPADVEAMMAKILDAFGTVDVAFNNAGIAVVGPAEETTVEDWDRVMDVNLKGVFLCSQAAARVMLKKKKGSIINMGSMSAHIANLPQLVAAYAATKAGVVQLSRNMAAEWAPHNVRVNVISPGYHMTEMAAQFTDLHKEWIPKIPMGRIAKCEELAGLVVFLASDASSYTTGAEIISDGGYTLW